MPIRRTLSAVISTRRALAVAAVGIALLAAACSGGGGHHADVAVGPNASATTSPDDVGGVTGAPGTDGATSTTKPGAKAKPGAKTVTVTTIVNGHVVTITVPVTDGGGGGGSSPTSPPTRTPTTVEQPVPYDPSKPINLCCTPGVTPQEQARAEELVRETLKYLPHYASKTTAYNEGYRWIEDPGTEHWVKWSLVDDNDILDPQHPESLVYQGDTLVAAMYMMPDGTTANQVPDIGGALTQWHVHNDLCLVQNKQDPLQWYLRGTTTASGSCTDVAQGAVKKGDVPMIHVWIVKNPCGPFAPLSGEGGGQTLNGEPPLCDTAHGSR
jgi:hypothetical protein